MKQGAYRLRTLFIALLIATLFSSIFTSPYVSAAAFSTPKEISNKQKAHLNIAFTGGGTTGTVAVCSADSIPLSGGDNAQRAWNYFIGKGFSEKQVAGIIGNFMEESAMNPKRVQGSGNQESETMPSSGGYGIAQWDDRKDDLANFARTRKKPIYDLGLQLDFVMYELNGKEKAAYQAFKPTTTIRDATTVWMEKYERPGDPRLSDRISSANKAYGDFATEAGNPATPPVSPTDTASCGGSGNIVAIAQAELAKGITEDPIGCDAGNPSRKGDCGEGVNKYTDNTLEYWCADFVSWVYKEAGTPFKGGASGGWRIASVESVQGYMERNGTFTKNGASAPDPQPGDVYVINNGEHIGIVVKVEGGKLYTISGNTSTENYSNGVGVGQATYNDFKSNPTITGYGGLR